MAADFIASSSRWGVEKPAAAFFERVIEVAGVPAAEITYLGDRLDNYILPARQAGMIAVFIRRGPWGCLHARRAEAEQAHARIESLNELPAVLEGLIPRDPTRSGPPVTIPTPPDATKDRDEMSLATSALRPLALFKTVL